MSEFVLGMLIKLGKVDAEKDIVPCEMQFSVLDNSGDGRLGVEDLPKKVKGDEAKTSAMARALKAVPQRVRSAHESQSAAHVPQRAKGSGGGSRSSSPSVLGGPVMGRR